MVFPGVREAVASHLFGSQSDCIGSCITSLATFIGRLHVKVGRLAGTGTRGLQGETRESAVNQALCWRALGFPVVVASYNTQNPLSTSVCPVFSQSGLFVWFCRTWATPSTRWRFHSTERLSFSRYRGFLSSSFSHQRRRRHRLHSAAALPVVLSEANWPCLMVKRTTGNIN